MLFVRAVCLGYCQKSDLHVFIDYVFMRFQNTSKLSKLFSETILNTFTTGSQGVVRRRLIKMTIGICLSKQRGGRISEVHPTPIRRQLPYTKSIFDPPITPFYREFLGRMHNFTVTKLVALDNHADYNLQVKDS